MKKHSQPGNYQNPQAESTIASQGESVSKSKPRVREIRQLREH
ncbi:MAG: hypothetical protein ACXW39_00530 [Nitrospira sp.]